MKNILFIPIVAALLLGGCAGTSTEFQCNATTSDRCMTMEQANEMARKKTEGAKGKPDAGALPALVELPPPSVTPLNEPPMSSLPLLATPSTATQGSQSVTATPSVIGSAVFTPSKPGAQPLRTDALCTSPRCETLGEATPLRLTDTIATVWIAPWIDAADVFHQPGRVSFVVVPGTWQLPQQIK